MFIFRARRALQLWTLFIVAVVVVIAGYRILEHYDLLPNYLCETRPVYQAEVTAEARREIDLLFENGLLYCSGIEAGLAPVDPVIYWGSDGVHAVLFFQALPGANLKGVGVSDYVYDDRYPPGPRGDRTAYGFQPYDYRFPVWRNMAPGDDPTWYYRIDGAPADFDVSVQVSLIGPAEEQEGTSERDFVRDLEYVWAYVRGAVPTEGARKIRRVWLVPIQPRRWVALMRQDINPALADAKGEYDPNIVARAELAKPTLLQTVQGLFGSNVWVAGVITDTTPAMLLAPRGGASGGEAVEPIASSPWVSPLGPMVLQQFAFPVQPAGVVLEARFWRDDATSETQPPDETWPVTFSAPATPTAQP